MLSPQDCVQTIPAHFETASVTDGSPVHTKAAHFLQAHLKTVDFEKELRLITVRPKNRYPIRD